MASRRRFLQGSATALNLPDTRLASASPLVAALSAAPAGGRQRAPAAGLPRCVAVSTGTGGHGHPFSVPRDRSG